MWFSGTANAMNLYARGTAADNGKLIAVFNRIDLALRLIADFFLYEIIVNSTVDEIIVLNTLKRARDATKTK